MSDNKRLIEQLLDEMNEEDRNILNQVAGATVMQYYMLPMQQVDMFHRIMVRLVTKNRDEFIAALEQERERMAAEGEEE